MREPSAIWTWLVCRVCGERFVRTPLLLDALDPTRCFDCQGKATH